MTPGFEGSPKFDGIGGDYARVMVFYDRVLILARDTEFDETATIVLAPKHARDLAAGIVAAAENAEAFQ